MSDPILEIKEYLENLSWDHYLPPSEIHQQVRRLLQEVEGKEIVFSLSEAKEPIPAYQFGKGDISTFWYGFPHPLAAVGSLTCLTLLKLFAHSPELFSPFRFCLVPCLDVDGATLNQDLFTGIEEMYSFAQSYYWNPLHLIDWSLNPPRLETQALLEFYEKQTPDYTFPLLEECLTPFPKLAFFVFGKTPDKKLTHRIRNTLKTGKQALAQNLHPSLGKAGFLLEELPKISQEKQDCTYLKALSHGSQIFWTELGSTYSEDIQNRQMSPYTPIEVGLEEKHLAQKLNKNLLSFFKDPQKETVYLPVIKYYQQWCKEKEALDFDEQEGLVLGRDLPHLTLGEWRAFQGELASHVTKLGLGIKHLEAQGIDPEAYEFEFLDLMDEYKKQVPFGRISPSILVKTQLLCILELLFFKS